MFKKIFTTLTIGALVLQLFSYKVTPAQAGVLPPVFSPYGEAWLIDSSLNFLRVDNTGASVSETGLSAYTNLGQTAVDSLGHVWSFTMTGSSFSTFNSELIEVTPSYAGPDLSTATAYTITNPAYPGYGYNLTAIAVGPNDDIWMAGYRTNNDVDFLFEIIRKPYGSSTLSFYTLPCLDPDTICTANSPTFGNQDSYNTFGLVISHEGDVFGQDFYNGRVIRLDFINKNYAATPTFDSLEQVDGINFPFGMFIDAADDLWITVSDLQLAPFNIGSNSKIIKADLTSNSFGTLSDIYLFSNGIAPTDILLTPTNQVVVSIYNNNDGHNKVIYDLTGPLFAQIDLEATTPFKMAISLDKNSQVMATSSSSGNLYVITDPDPTTPVYNTYSLNFTTALEKLVGDFNGYQNSIINGTGIDVDIFATVDPTISLVVSSANCDLQTLSVASVGSCNYTVTTATNAQNGLVVKFLADTATLVSGANDIDACSGADCDGADTTAGVTAGSEEYGFYVSTANHTATGYTTEAQPLPTTATTVLSTTGPHNSTSSTITHKAAVSSLTTAGAYSELVTITATGSF